MSFLSSLLGRSDGVYTPFGHEYFAARVAREQALRKKAATASIDGYEVLEEFEGGMGKVLIGRNEDGLAAIKTLKTRIVLPEDADRLAEEAAKLIGLDPLLHLVPEDICSDSASESCRVVLPYCAGGSLDDRAASGRLEFDELVYYGFVLAAELARLHQSGILHLDLKPANVLLQRAPEKNDFYRWRPVISDYGLSVYRQQGKAVPSSGGTPYFMAPEQCLGQNVEAHTDVWCYGATLYYLACRQSPLASIWPLGRDGSSKTVKPLGDVREDCPNWFSAVVSSCLEVAPARRATFRDLLAEYLRHVRIEDDKVTKYNGSAGPSREQARLTIRDSFALTHATRLGLSKNNGYIGRMDFGWATKLQRAEKLFATHSAAPSRKALALVDSVLGDWAEPTSVLAQFKANASQRAFKVPDRPPAEGLDAVHSIETPLPREAIWQFLDLRCRCLINIAEDLGRPADVEDLRRTATTWLVMGDAGLPPEGGAGGVPRYLCLFRIAQALRLAGKFGAAKLALEPVIHLHPNELGPLLAYAYALRDQERYDEAAEFLKRAVVACFEQRNQRMYAVAAYGLADLRVRKGDLPLALETYEQLAGQIAGPQIELARAVVKSRLGKLKDPPEVVSAWAVSQLIPGTNVNALICAAELELWAGKKDLCAEMAARALRDPRMRLPTWAYERSQAEALLGRARA
jgi:serine/threonine protein kinase